MRMHALAAVVAALSTGPTNGDLDQLQGRWGLVCVERGGKPLQGQGVPTPGMHLVVEGYRLRWTGGGEVPAGTFRLDSSQQLKAINIVPGSGPRQGQTHLGIYMIEGETLKVCHATPGRKRPTEFKSEEGSEDTLFVLKRAVDGESRQRGTSEGRDPQGLDDLRPDAVLIKPISVDGLLSGLGLPR